MHRLTTYLVLVERVNEGDEPPSLGTHSDGHLGNVLHKDGVEMAAEFQVVSCTQWL